MKKVFLLMVTALLLCLLLTSCGTKTPTGDNKQTVETDNNQPNDNTQTTNTYTVTFDTQGGTEIATQQVEKGGKAQKPIDPEKKGYVFSGWLCNNEVWSFIGFSVTEDVTLTAKWEPMFSVSDEGVLKGLTDLGKTISVIEIPLVYDGVTVTSIGSHAFYRCPNLTSIIIPNSVTSIGNRAFAGCTNLTEFVIPNSVTSIGQEAFEDCTNLASITIPNSVTNIGYNAFNRCTALAYSTYSNAQYLGNVQNPYVVLVKTTNDNITSCTIHENTAVIYSFAFYRCTNLTTIIIPNAIKSISSSAFYDCANLTSVVLENNVLFIGNDAFAGCKGLTSIIIPDSITRLGNDAFLGCTGLTGVTIPDSVTSIGDGAFCGCTGLASVTYQGTKAQWDAISKGSYWNDSTGNYTVHCTDGDIAK